MTDYDLIEKIIKLEEKVKDLELQKMNDVLFICLTIGCGLFFIGSLICAIISNKDRY